jgi:hypothetical protein
VVVLLLLEEVNHHLTSTPNGVVQEYYCQFKLEPFEISNNVGNAHEILYKILVFWLPVDTGNNCGVGTLLLWCTNAADVG